MKTDSDVLMELQKEGFIDFLGSLFERWEDEKEFESWSEYHNVIVQEFNGNNMKVLKTNSSPFFVTFERGNSKYKIVLKEEDNWDVKIELRKEE